MKATLFDHFQVRLNSAYADGKEIRKPINIIKHYLESRNRLKCKYKGMTEPNKKIS